jgi:Family of unknown function (DUF6584)
MTEIRIPEDARFDRVRNDLDRGRLWKARDRLNGMLRQDPADQAVLELLGSIWFEMGDLPQAGRYWWVTSHGDESADVSRDAFYERFGTVPATVLRALPRLAETDVYPDEVRQRLDELIGAAGRGQRSWRPPHRRSGTPLLPAADGSGRTERLRFLLGLAVTTGLGVVFVVGFVTVVGAILDLLFG